MINVLTRYKEETSYVESFNVIEKELAKIINTIACIDRVVIIKERIFNRLSKVEPDIKTSKFIYTFKRNLKEIFDKKHHLQSVMTSEVMDVFEQNEFRIKGNDRLITCIDNKSVNCYLTCTDEDKDPYELIFEHQPFQVNLTRNEVEERSKKQQVFSAIFTETENFISKNCNDAITLDIFNTYINGIKTSDKKAISIGRTDIKDRYESRVYNALTATIELLDNYDKTEYMYIVISDIAELDANHLRKFNENCLSEIPFIDSENIPITIIKHISPDETVNIYIKTKNGVTHLSYVGNLYLPDTTYQYYKIGQGSSIKIFGYEFDIDENCFESDKLELFKMAMYGKDGLTISTNIKFDYALMRTIAMEFEKNDIHQSPIYNYLLARFGLFKNKKR